MRLSNVTKKRQKIYILFPEGRKKKLRGRALRGLGSERERPGDHLPSERLRKCERRELRLPFYPGPRKPLVDDYRV